MKLENDKIKNKIDMKKFESMVESAKDVEEFKGIISDLGNQKIDEVSGRVEKFDFNNIGNFHENTVENYLKELSTIKALKKERILELVEAIQNGETSAREELIEGSLKLVAKIALLYSKTGTSYMELIQDGLMGIVHAIEHYDLNSSVDFTHYMEFWIKYEMIKSNKIVIDELKTPIKAYYKHMKTEMYMNKNKDEVEIDGEKIRKELNMEVEEFETLQNMNTYGFLMKEEDRKNAKTYSTIEEVDLELEKLDRLMAVSNLANKFTMEEIEILDLYYGLSGKRKYFEEIGKIFDMKPEEVKSKIEKLMVKLKYNGKKEWIDEN